MSLVERYILRNAALAFLAGLAALTGVIWITQSLRQVDLLTTKGQTLLIFFALTGLTLPSLIVVIAPIALFIGVVYTLNRLNGDSELVILSAAGVSPGRLLRPFLVLTTAVMLLVASMSLWAMPASFNEIRDLVMKIRADFLTRVVREGSFASLTDGFVFHYRERGPDGSLRGIFMQDRRDPNRINTYLAQMGATVETNHHNFLVLENGSVQRQTRGDRDPAIVLFDRYAIDLAQFGPAGQGAARKPRERSTLDLLRLNPKDPYVKQHLGDFRAELNDRLVNPLYALVLGLIGFATQSEARTTRQGRGATIGAAVAAVLVLRGAGFWASALASDHVWALLLVYGIPAVGLGGALIMIFGASWRRALATLAPRRPGRLLGRPGRA
ncbi:MAG TPA: LPS export ABC transporter permease LptF [Beijerinckiaceae bacterium]|nr:LPS export ABC transporter permease LptF [Beijerinckiaceae bacterium]HVB89894.1 LPS export ABC transporter permease LptF [Beijerinckiaceae bacterium]